MTENNTLDFFDNFPSPVMIFTRRSTGEFYLSDMNKYASLSRNVFDVEDPMDKSLKELFKNKAHKEIEDKMNLAIAGSGPYYEIRSMDNGAPAFKYMINSISSDSVSFLIVDDGVNDVISTYHQNISIDPVIARICRQSEWYDLLVSNFSDGVYVLDNQGYFLYVNDVIEKRAGLSKDDFKKIHFNQIVQPQDHERVDEHFNRVMSGEELPPYELAYTRKDGSTAYVEINTRRIEENGIAVGLVGISRDITDKKTAQKERDEQNLMFSELAEKSPNMIFINDLKGVVYANSMCEKVLGYTKDEFYSDNFNFMDIVAPETHEMIRTIYKKHLAGEEVEPYEYDLITKEGVRINAINSTKVIKYKDGIAILGIVTDISCQKEYERALLESEEKFRILADNASVSIFMHGGKNFLFVNKACELLTGYSNKEIMDMGVAEILHPDYKKVVTERIIDQLAGKQKYPAGYEEKIMRKDGTERWITLSVGGPIEYMDQKVLIGTVLDITDRKLAQAEIIQAQKLASIGQLVAGVAHEINNPLSALSGEVQWLLEKMKRSKYRKSLEFIYRITERIDSIISKMLVFSRETAERVKKPEDIIQSIDNVLLLMKKNLSEKSIRIVKHIEGDIPKVMMSKEQIEQVLLNIIMNSADAIERDGEINISVSYYAKTDTITLMLRDNGSGISKKDLNRVFDPFFTTKSPGMGTGLGLSISMEIVKSHGGAISVDSIYSGGTTVLLKLPVS